MPILEIDKMKVESKWHALKTKAKETARNALQWAKENPELCAVVTAAAGAGVKGLKSLVRTHNIHREQYNKDRYIYDRSLGMYLKTRRPLRNKDYIMINRRRRNGEKLSDILTSMNILD